MEKQEFVCIVCPRSCRLSAEREDSASSWQITGNSCPRGEEYALSELTNPQRVLTGLMRVTRNGELLAAPLSIKTTGAVPKAMLLQAMDEIHRMQAAAPVHAGDVVISNLMNLGVDVIATKTIE